MTHIPAGFWIALFLAFFVLTISLVPFLVEPLNPQDASALCDDHELIVICAR